MRIIPTSETHLQLLVDLHGSGSELFTLDFWKEPRAVNKPVDIMVGPNHLNSFQNWLAENNLKATVWQEDVQKLIDKEAASMKQAMIKPFNPADLKSFDFSNYHTFDEIKAFVKSVATTYPDIASVFSLGNSVEGREILGLKIGKAGTNKNGFWIDGGIHAREWISPAVALYTINELTSKYATDASIKNYVDKVDFYIAPNVNPDGYEYSRLTDRLWRKNRSKQKCSVFQCCYGVDLNRNFPFHYGESGTSSNPCSEIFLGQSALSEPEAKALSNAILQRKDQLKAMITLHSYSEDWLVPYGYAIPAVYPDDYNELLDAAQNGAKAGAAKTGVSYTVANSAAGLYAAAGASDDWSKSIGIKYVYTIEVRPGPDDPSGFVLPANQIIPTSTEIFEGLKVIADRVIAVKN